MGPWLCIIFDPDGAHGLTLHSTGDLATSTAQTFLADAGIDGQVEVVEAPGQTMWLLDGDEVVRVEQLAPMDGEPSPAPVQLSSRRRRQYHSLLGCEMCDQTAGTMMITEPDNTRSWPVSLCDHHAVVRVADWVNTRPPDVPALLLKQCGSVVDPQDPPAPATHRWTRTRPGA